MHALLQDLSALEAEYQRSFVSIDSQGKQPADEAARRQDAQQAQREVQSPHAAVMLRGAFALGLEGAQAGPVSNCLMRRGAGGG